MAEVVKRARQKNRDLLPDEMADYEILELTDTEVAYARTAEDKRGRVGKTGRALVNLAIASGAYEEIPLETGPDEDPVLETRVKELEKQLRDERRNHKQEIDDLKRQLSERDASIAELRQQLADRDRQIAELRQQISEIQQATTGLVDQMRQRGAIDDQAAEEIEQHLDRAGQPQGTQRQPARQPQPQPAPQERQPQQPPDQQEQASDGQEVVDRVKGSGGKEYVIVKKGDKLIAIEVEGKKPGETNDDDEQEEDDKSIDKVGEFERGMKVGKKEGEKYRLGYEVIGFKKEADGSERIRIKRGGQEPEWVKPDEIKRESEIDDAQTLVEEPGTPPPPGTRRTEIIEEEHHDTRRRIGGIALAAAGAYIAWELIERYVLHWEGGGSGDLKKVIHNQAVEINNLHKINNHLTEVDKHIHRELWHDHKHELKKLSSIQRMVHRLLGEEAREHKGYGFHEHLKDSGAYWGFRYPWDWAVSKVGYGHAEGWLHTLGNRAAAAGHHVQWIQNGHEPNGAVREIMKVDGTTNTQKVIGVVSHFGK